MHAACVAPRKRGGASLAEQMRCVPITEDRREFGVKLGERGPKGVLTGRVGAAPEVAGDGMRCMRKEISESECVHRLAPPPLPLCLIPRESLIGGAQA
jgi:hypothetical protein